MRLLDSSINILKAIMRRYEDSEEYREFIKDLRKGGGILANLLVKTEPIKTWVAEKSKEDNEETIKISGTLTIEKPKS